MEKRPISKKTFDKNSSTRNSSSRNSSTRNSSNKNSSGKSVRSNNSPDNKVERPMRRREEPRRIRKFSDPEIPESITGEELEKRDRYQLSGLTEENALTVARHLVALSHFLETDPERAYWHGQSASFRAGRLALVRERAGIAALKSGRLDVAQRELKAALRISGNQGILPYLAEAERALGNPRKALETLGKVKMNSLKDAEEVELRIVSAQCRIDLGQPEAAVVTLTCKQLNTKDALWSEKLIAAYERAKALAGR